MSDNATLIILLLIALATCGDCQDERDNVRSLWCDTPAEAKP